MRSLLVRLLAIVALGVSVSDANAQVNFTWLDNTSDWGTITAWSPVGPPNLTGAVVGHVAIFGNQATILNQPTLNANSYAINRLQMDNTGADWSLGGTGTLSLANTGTTNSTSALQVTGAGTTVIGANLQLLASNFWFASAGATIDFQGGISSSTATNSLNLRPELGATIRLSGTNTLSATNGVTIGAGTGGAGTARLEINTANALGAGNLTFGGSTASFTLSAIGSARTITNNAIYGVNFSVDGTNDLTFSGTLTNTSSANRSITSNTTSGAKLIFTNNIGIRATADATVGTTRDLTLAGTGRIDISGNILNNLPVSGAALNRVIINGGANFIVRLSGTGSDYNGNTEIQSGTLLLGATAANGAVGSLGNNTLTVAVGNTSGTANAAVLTDAAVNIGRSFNVRTGNTGIATFGGNSADVSNFNNAISIGTNATTNAKTVQLTAASGGTVNFNGNLSLASGYTGIASVDKLGAGTVVLASTGSYNGTTTVSNGTLLVNGTLSSATAAVTVNSGATLGGSGTINRDVIVNGTLSPGTAAGNLTLGANLTFGSNSSFVVELGGATAGTEYDQVTLAGTASTYNIGSNVGLTLNITGGYVPGLDSAYVIVNNTGNATANSGTGAFNGLAEGSQFLASNGQTFEIHYNVGTFSIVNHAFVLNSAGNNIVVFTPVPEPGAMLLLSSSILAAGYAVRRRWRGSRIGV